MKISEFKNKFNLKLLTDEGFSDREVTGCYIGDLLSHVMGKAASGNAWVTIMTNVNIVAVASLVDAACILVCEGTDVSEDVLEKANEQDVIILQSEKTAYEIAKAVAGVL